MALLLNTQFADPSLPEFYVKTPGATSIRGRGINGGRALTCLNGSVGFRLTDPFTQFDYDTVAVRTQFGFLSGISTPWPLSILDFSHQFGAGSSYGQSFGAVLEMNADGSVTLNMPNGTTPAAPTSAPGVFPHDGTVVGIQVSFAFPDSSTCDYSVVINNVVVLSGTHTQTIPYPIAGPCAGVLPWIWKETVGPDACYPAAAINVVDFHAYSLAGGVPHMSVTAEAIVDTDPSIISYPNNATVLPASLSSCTPIVAHAVVTDLTVDCGANQVTITGTDFLTLPDPTIDLQGPQGEFVDHTLLSIDSTTIVLQLTDPFISGDYCVTVTNRP